jgi:CBS domain-containing protein
MVTNITGPETTREELIMPIEDLARSDVVTAAPDTPVTDLAVTMDDENVGSVVITSGETPVGIVTDRDLTVRVLGGDVDPSEQTAEDVMTGDLCTMERNAGFYEAAELMAEHGIRRLPICDGDTLVGIITSDDLNELLADEQQHFAEIIRAQRSAY